MRALLFTLTFLAFLEASQPAQDLVPQAVSPKTLTYLSQEGEKLVEEEVQRALYGIKQIKEVMSRNEVKHELLMSSLQNSSEKKKTVTELAQNVANQIDEAEQQCKETQRTSWDECRPCLENTCKNFYTNTCRRGFATFSSKLEGFYRRVSARLGLESTPEEDAVNRSAALSDFEVIKSEYLFSNMTANVGILVNRSMALVSRFHSKLDKVLSQTFASEPQQEKETEDLDLSFLQRTGLEQVLDSFVDFARHVVEEFGAAVTRVFDDLHGAIEEAERNQEKQLFSGFLQSRKLCKDLRRQSSECWQLQSKCQACQGTLFSECPSMWDLQIELDEVSELLEVAKKQYEEVLDILQHHTEDTMSWIHNMVAQFGWVAELADGGTIPENVFSINAVKIAEDINAREEETNTSAADSNVEVNILNAPTFTLTVPGSLQPQDPAFIQYVASEALGFYKQKTRLEDV